MASMKGLTVSGGGGNPEWLPMELSNTNHTISANWGYVAEQVVIAFKLSSYVWFVLVNMSAPDNIIYGVAAGAADESGATFSGNSMTASAGADGKSFSITHNASAYTFSKAYIMPLTNGATFS